MKALHKLSYGLYVVSSKKGDKLTGQIANTVFQITSSPATAAVSINKENFTHECIEDFKHFGVSILTESADMQLIGRFGFKSGRDMEKFDGVKSKTGETGVPLLLEHTSALLEFKVIEKFDLFTHTLFIGELVNAEIISDENVMTYEYYHRIKGGKAPKSAPTYIEEKKEIKKEDGKMKNYKCSVCGYVYDPQKGDPDNGIEPGTSFDDLPDDWVCPVCGVGKDQFEEE